MEKRNVIQEGRTPDIGMLEELDDLEKSAASKFQPVTVSGTDGEARAGKDNNKDL